MVRIITGPGRSLVGQRRDAGQRAPLDDIAFFSKADNGIALAAAHVGRQVHVLAGKILMDEKYIHVDTLVPGGSL